MFRIATLCIGLYLTVVSGNAVTSRQHFFSDNHRAVEFEETNDGQECAIHGDRDYIKSLYLDQTINVVVVSPKKMEELIKECEFINKNKTADEHRRNIIRKKRFIIHPGTKWCGTGNSASNYDDLGEAVQTDTCCRTHDTCGGPHIAPWSSQYGITNYAIWYKKHCPCDDVFHACLKNVTGEEAAATVGDVFFNFLGIECIEETGNTVKTCVERSWFGWCVKEEDEIEMRFRDAKTF